MSRPIEIDKAKLKALMRLKPTLEDTAAFFECSVRTIERFVKDEFGVVFKEFRDANMVHTRFALIRKALDLADKGNVTMLIFCLKNVCGWTDKHIDGTQVLISQPQVSQPFDLDRARELIKIARSEK